MSDARPWLLAGTDADQLARLAREETFGSVTPILVHAETPEGLAGHVAERLVPPIEGVVVAGGDRELHHVVDGARQAVRETSFPPLPLLLPDDPFADPARSAFVRLAFVPDRSSSLARTIGLRDRPGHLGTAKSWGLLDLGHVTITDADGHTITTVLVNGLIAGTLLESAKLLRRPAPPRLSLQAHARPARRRDAPLGEWMRHEPLALLAIMNTQHRGHQRIAPRAVPHDGCFDILAGSGDARDATAWQRRMPRGEHVPDPAITELLADSVAITSDDPFTIELDGDVRRARSVTIELESSPFAITV